MEIFKEIIRRSKDYFYNLINDIKDLDFSFISLKKFILKRKVFILAILLLFLILGSLYGNYKFSKNFILEKLEIALKENKPGKIYKYIEIDGEKISKSDLEPLCEYYFEKDNLVNNVIKGLKSNGDSEFIRIVEKNNVFNKYSIQIKLVNIELTSNFDNTIFYLNDKKVESNKVEGIIPGKYVVRGDLETIDGLISEEKEIFILDSTTYDLKMPAINLNLTSNFDDAKVYINDKDIKKKVSDIKNYGPIPLDKEFIIQLEKEFPWGTIQSEKVSIGNLPNINININIANENLINEIEESLKIFYDSVFEALNKSDYNLIKNSEEDIKNRIYNDIKRESLFLKNNYDLKDLSIEVKSSEFYYEDSVYKSNIVANLNYKISKKILSFIGKEIEETFLTELEYIDGSWEVVGIQKINLD